MSTVPPRPATTPTAPATKPPPVHHGTLPDSEILDLGAAGKLIEHEFDAALVKQACYELRASDVYYEPPDSRKRQASPSGYILIKPKQLVVVITKESINLPNDVLGRILTKGQLFSIGLLPVNTYADPGFQGQLGIVLYNLSNQYLRIRPGDAIAKIEFTRLEVAVTKPYRGQHGYATGIWPIPVDHILTTDDMQADKRIGHLVDELEQSYGKGLGDLTRRVFRYERRLIIGAAIYLAATGLLLVLTNSKVIHDYAVNIMCGVVGSVIASLFSFFATNVRGK